MRSRISRQPDREPLLPGPDDDGLLDDELAAVVAAARRRVLRDGDRHIDTAHLLHSLLEHDPEVRAVLDGGPRLARVLGYLVQRSIGYGLRWRDAVEHADAGEVPVGAGDGFSPLAADAMRRARARALRRGGAPARGLDLLAAIVTDSEARAVEVLNHAGVGAEWLLARIEGGATGTGGVEGGATGTGGVEGGATGTGGVESGGIGDGRIGSGRTGTGVPEGGLGELSGGADAGW